jgi:hypothetical protein
MCSKWLSDILKPEKHGFWELERRRCLKKISLSLHLISPESLVALDMKYI